MRLLTVTALLSVSASTGFCQNKPASPAQPEHIRLLAEHEIREGGTIKLRGHVQVVSASTIVYADEADYNWHTGELDARGHVHIDLKKATPNITIQDATPEDIPLGSPSPK